MDAAQAAREYYRALDEDDYETLAGLVGESFTHYRPDRTIEGGEAFVAFMREDRPVKETTHVVEEMYEGPGGVAVQGRLEKPDGEEWFAFVDVFTYEDGKLVELTTYV